MRCRYCLKYLDNPDDHVICCWTSNFIFLQRVKVKRGCQKTWQQRGGAPGLSEGSVQLTQLDTRLQTGNCPHKTDGGQSGERGCRTDVVHSEERRQMSKPPEYFHVSKYWTDLTKRGETKMVLLILKKSVKYFLSGHFVSLFTCYQ